MPGEKNACTLNVHKRGVTTREVTTKVGEAVMLYMLAPKLEWLTKLALSRQSWLCQKTFTKFEMNSHFQLYV